jgi:hypothetical protein
MTEATDRPVHASTGSEIHSGLRQSGYRSSYSDIDMCQAHAAQAWKMYHWPGLNRLTWLMIVDGSVYRPFCTWTV